MYVVCTLVCVDGFKVDEVSDDVVFVRDAVSAVDVACFACDVECFAAIIALHQADEDGLYAGLDSAGVYRSLDDGSSWDLISGDLFESGFVIEEIGEPRLIKPPARLMVHGRKQVR